MACLKSVITVVFLLLISALLAKGSPVKTDDNTIEGSGDQVTSGTVAKDSKAAGTSTKADLKGSDSFGLGYYLVTPTIVKYHYPVVYYPTYLHSVRHHGYGGYYYHHGGVIH